MANVTKSTLLHFRNSGHTYDPGGFVRAGTISTEQLAVFQQVVSGLAGGVVWSGAGQPQASNVALNNGQALEIARVMMDAGNTAVSAVETALGSLASNLDGLNEYAKSLGFWMEEDGRVIPRDTGNSDNPDPSQPEKIRHLTAAAQHTLKLATAADLACLGSITTVTQAASRLVLSSTAVDGNPNAAGLDQALEDRDGIITASAPYFELSDATLVSAADVKDNIANHRSPDALEESNEKLDDLLNTLKDYGLGKIPHSGQVIAVITGDVTSILSDVVESAVKAEVKAAGGAALLRVFGRVNAVVGAATTAGAVFEGLLKALAPDEQKELPTIDVKDPSGQVRGKVYDTDLQVLAEDYYGAGGGNPGGDVDTLADLAHKQRVGADVPAGQDYVQEAQQVRTYLQEWLDAHGTEGADAIYAQQLVKELDFALGQ